MSLFGYTNPDILSRHQKEIKDELIGKVKNSKIYNPDKSTDTSKNLKKRNNKRNSKN